MKSLLDILRIKKNAQLHSVLLSKIKEKQKNKETLFI